MTLQALEQRGLSVIGQWKERRTQRQERLRQEENDTEFMRQLAQTKQKLQIARENFNTVTDSELTEYYIYKIKAEETRLNYYLSRAKKECRSHLGDVARSCRADDGGRCV